MFRGVFVNQSKCKYWEHKFVTRKEGGLELTVKKE